MSSVGISNQIQRVDCSACSGEVVDIAGRNMTISINTIDKISLHYYCGVCWYGILQTINNFNNFERIDQAKTKEEMEVT